MFPRVLYHTLLQPKYTLDYYSGAIGAFSVRLLHSSFENGSPVRVRRTVAGVNTEANVYFNSLQTIGLDSRVDTFSGGTSSSTNLGEFVASTGYSNPDGLTQSTSAFVSVWRNQINPVNSLFATASTQQPRLVNSGVLELSHNHVAISFFFDGTNLNFFPFGATISTAASNAGLSIFSVGRSNNNTAGQTIANFSILNLTTNGLANIQNNGNQSLSYLPGSGAQVYSGGGVINYEYAYWSTVNTSLVPRGFSTVVSALTATTSFFTGSTGSSSFNANRINVANRYSQSTINNGWRGWISEAIFYNSDQYLNRLLISQDQIDYFSRYYEPEYNRILAFAQATSISILPSDAIKLKDNKLIRDLKAAGIWNKLDVFYMFSTDGIAAFSCINWKNPGSNTAQFVNGLTIGTNTGVTGNGTTGYMQLSYNPSTQGTNYTQNNASRFAWIGNTASGVIDSNNISGLNNSITIANSVNQRINSVNALDTAYQYNNTIGLKSIHRTSSTSITLIEGTQSTVRGVTSSSTNFSNIQYLLRANSVSSSVQIRAYAMGSSMIDENQDFLNALAERLA